MITLEQLQEVWRPSGDHVAYLHNYFHENGCTRAVGPRGGVKLNIFTWRRNGKLKLWKTRPGKFSLPIAYGFYEHGYLTRENAQHFHLPNDCPALKAQEKAQEEAEILKAVMQPW